MSILYPQPLKGAAEKRPIMASLKRCPDTHSLLKGKRIVVAILLLVALSAIAKSQPHA
jgi:hypothetical protein